MTVFIVSIWEAFNSLILKEIKYCKSNHIPFLEIETGMNVSSASKKTVVLNNTKFKNGYA